MLFLIKILILLLIFTGGVYIIEYEDAPFWQRLQVFGVGLGMYIGIILAWTV